MHSEHDLKERQRRTNHSESFSLWDATLLHNRGASRLPFFIICGASRHHPMNPVNLLNPMNLHTAGMSKGKKPK